jgi:GNAT superfamily N-acetyltransferase
MESVSDQSREEVPRRRPFGDADDGAYVPSPGFLPVRRVAAAPSGGALSGPTLSHNIHKPVSDAPRLVTGHAGDHRLVHALLRAVQQSPSQEDFATWLDEPSYEPTDRLLVKRGNQIVAHLQLLYRGAWFHGIQIPVGSVQDLAILPEYRRAGYERLLVSAAEQAMHNNQSVVSIVRTDRPDVFRSCGWTEAESQGYSQANVNDVLAHLTAQAAVRRRRLRHLRIRLWRHVELDAVRTVYRTSAANLWGSWLRPEPYWRWLVARRAHSEVIVAIDGPDEINNLQSQPNIVGYAVTHGSRVVELCTLPEYPGVALRLLARACRDAIEHDCRTLSIHVPATDPLHEVIVTAGGCWCTDAQNSGGTLMVKLIDPTRWIEAMYIQIQRRAKLAGLERPCEIVFATGRHKQRFVLTHRSSRLVRDDETPADVACSPETFSALLVGNLNVAQAAQARLLRANRPMLDKLAVLFPPTLFWQSQFDMLRL